VIINLYKHRGYIWRTGVAEVRHHYAGSALGVLWNVVQPLCMIGVLTIIFTTVFNRPDTDNVPYVVYLCSAMLPWSAFGECLTRGAQSFIANATYLRKLPIPEQVFVAQSAVGSLIHLGINYGLLVIVALIAHCTPTWHWLLLPLPLSLLIALGFGFGVGLGTVNAFIRDVGSFLPFVIQIGFWFYPIVYNPAKLPTVMKAAILCNPVYPFLESIRMLFLHPQVPGPGLWLGMILWCIASSAIGYSILRKLRPELRDVI
jgi:ABC-type polysaccharide/polyol phosphate export permease